MIFDSNRIETLSILALAIFCHPYSASKQTRFMEMNYYKSLLFYLYEHTLTKCLSIFSAHLFQGGAEPIERSHSGRYKSLHPSVHNYLAVKTAS